MNEFVETLLDVRFAEPKRTYDVVIIGGGGHGLSTAYHLAARHGITNVAVLERGYIGSGNSGRNTTIIRANYGLPEAVRFYQHSLELYQRLEDETGCDVMHASKGILWLAHSITTARTERGRALLNTACGAKTSYVEPEEIATICPQIDLAGGGRYPVLGASYHARGGDGPPRPRRLGLRAGRRPPRCRPRAGHRGHRAHRRRRPGDGGGDRRRPDRRRDRPRARSAAGSRGSPTGPASACPFARTRCRRS